MDTHYIIASLGRCGSTLVTHTVTRALGRTPPPPFVQLDNYAPDQGPVYKTHSLAPESIPEGGKVIFIFGDPRNIVVSTRSMHLRDMHCEHMGADPLQWHVWPYKDILNLEANFDSWYQPHDYEVLSIRYEKMFENFDVLNGFLGMDIAWPPHRPRKSDWSKHPLGQEIAWTYNSLWRKVESAEDVRIWKPTSCECEGRES